MSSAKRYLLIALSFALALTIFAVFAPRTVHAITAALVQVVNTPANPVPISAATHLGQPHDNLVTIFSGKYGQHRVRENGEFESGWAVPAGQVLIVTDYSWEAVGFPANEKCWVYLGYPDVRDLTSAVADADGVATGSRHTTVAVGPGWVPSVMTCSSSYTLSGGAYIHGYLVAQ